MSGWGDLIFNSYGAALAGAQDGARVMMASIGSAASAVKQRAAATAVAVRDGAVAVGKGAYNAGSFAARASVEAVGAAGSVASAPYRVAKKVLSPAQTPRKTMIEPCINSWEAKKRRLEERNARIDSGKRSGDPAVREAAKRLARNTESVELARLSEDTYAQYPPTKGHHPPLGWTPMSDAELEAAGIDKELLADSQAVIYRSDPSWPGGQKTVLAFRGTADLDDGIVDHDQAMGLPTSQYRSAVKLGDSVSEHLGKDVIVTGHSLGGGKAQTAGAVGGLKGMMFNSAGLNPKSVDGEMPESGQFQQYRTFGDPLTGVQNSPGLQTLVAGVVAILALPLGAGVKAGDALEKTLGMRGLSTEQADYADKVFKVLPRGLKNIISDGNVLPPAIGAVTEVPSLDGDGNEVALLNPKQHSITFLVNGIEQQKSQDIATLTPE